MFGLFKKKTQLETLISKDGIDHATTRIAEMISSKLTSREIAYQFILEELDGARRGNEASMKFAAESGIPAHEYQGAISNSRPEVDGPGGPQQLLMGLCLELMSDQDLMAKFRCMVDDKIMRKFEFGKYASQEKYQLPEDLSLITTRHIEEIAKKELSAKVGEILRRAANAGSTDAAVFMALMLHKAIEVRGLDNVPQKMLEEFEHFMRLAAEQGEVTSQANLAKHYLNMSKIGEGSINAEGYEFLKKAEFWYKKAAAQGFESAIESLKNMNEVFSWAHQEFGDQEHSN
ncbi:tetratricopeptide repeat protein [Azohydromonas aeria]|uniref:tetratricopeptide repeat protein n=1 Tax=Azohydromonas aeria TaxID=2590212 RepID=UPI0012FAD8A8|nr:hypothetical protein [Azohydromonas aeria]